MARIECGDARSALDEHFPRPNANEVHGLIAVLTELVPGMVVQHTTDEGWIVEEPTE